MSNLQSLEIYAFDIFEITQKNDVLSKLGEHLGEINESSHSYTSVGTAIKEVIQKTYIPKQCELESIIKIATKSNEKKFLGKEVEFCHQAIKKIEITGIESEILPFFLLMIKAEVDISFCSIEKLGQEIKILARPLRLAIEEFKGITTKIRPQKPVCPYYVDVGIIPSEKELTEIQDSVKWIGDNYSKGSIEGIPKVGEKIRVLFPLQELEKNLSLASIPYFDKNNVIFSGTIEQQAMNGLMTSFVVSYSKIKRKQIPENFKNVPRIMPCSNIDLVYSEKASGSMIFLIGILTWAIFLENNIPEREKALINLRKLIHGKLETYNEKKLEQVILSLEKKSYRNC